MILNKLNLSFVLFILAAVGLGCGTESAEDRIGSATPAAAIGKPRKIEKYSLRGMNFAYFLVPSNLGRDELIQAARQAHNDEPNCQIIFIDDDSQLEQYVKYAKGVSSGNYDSEIPLEWAETHIIANIQKYINGKYVLCEGNGYKEIAEL